MNNYVYCIYDELTGEYSRLFSAPNDDVAARLFLGMTFNPGEKLFCVGVYSPYSGVFEGSDPSLVDLDSCVNKLKEQINERKKMIKELSESNEG